MVVTFGEMMLRLSTQRFERLTQSHALDVNYGGSEANVAMALAGFGMPCAHVTRLPKNALGQACAMKLQGHGVLVDRIIWGDGRLGTYYLETGASPRASKVIYDRANSAFSQLHGDMLNWNEIFSDASWFHFSGITPALSEELESITLQSCREAYERGITVSCDLNVRKNLWSKEKAATVMGKILPYVDILIANETQAASLFDLSALPSEDDADYSTCVAKQLHELFLPKTVALTRRRTFSAVETSFEAMLYDGTQTAHSPCYRLQFVDRVGSGDAFSAGLIYALQKQYSLQDAVSFAAAACAMKHSVPGDVLYATVSEVKAIAEGESTQIQR